MDAISFKTELRSALVIAICAAAASSVGAGTIQLVDPVTGQDSGWQAAFPDSALVSLVVDAVTDDAVFIQKFVDFDQPPGAGNLIPTLSIDFTQTLPDGKTVPSIVIADEGLTNLTGVDWTGFNWLIVNMGEAWFNASRSSDFKTDPFNNQHYTSFLGGDANRPTVLRSDGGIVPHLDTYFPGFGTGELWIDVDLFQQPITSFLLKEIPVPEPGTLFSLMAGLMLARGRIRRRRQMTIRSN